MNSPSRNKIAALIRNKTRVTAGSKRVSELPLRPKNIALVSCQSTQVLVWVLLWPSQGGTTA